MGKTDSEIANEREIERQRSEAISKRVGSGGRDSDIYRPDPVGSVQKSRKAKADDNDCFPEGTLVLSALGWRKIETIKKGDLVLAYCVNQGFSLKKVARTVRHKENHIYSVVSQMPGKSFDATRRHPILTERGWVRVQDLVEGDKVPYLSERGDWAEHQIDKVLPFTSAASAYNLIVEGNFTYVTKACFAHSFVYLRTVRTFINKAVNAVSIFPAPKAPTAVTIPFSDIGALVAERSPS